MSLTDILPAKNIEAALKSVEKVGSFDYKEFFLSVGIRGKSPGHVRMVFQILDRSHRGFLMEDTAGEFLQNFSDKARKLTPQEIKKFMKDGDFDRDGKIGIDDFQAMANN